MSELTPNLKLFKYDPVADAKQPLDITKAWNNNWDILDKNTGGVPIGMIYPAILGIDESENKYRYLNGQIIVQEQFINFTNWLKSKLKTASNMFTTEQNWQAEKTASVLGQCGKFVVDDTAGTIRLPLVININGLTDLANCGVLKDESLPNVTGHIQNVGVQYDNLSYSGAFKNSVDLGRPNNWAMYDPNVNWAKLVNVQFSASSSSATYQDNAPVQQEAIQYPYVIVVNTGVEEAERPINNYQVNNVYSYGMSTYYKGTMSNSSWLRSSGQWNSGTVYNGAYEWAVGKLNEKVYDPSKFTVVGSPTITSDGIASGFSTRDYLEIPINLTNSSLFSIDVEVDTRVGTGSGWVYSNPDIATNLCIWTDSNAKNFSFHFGQVNLKSVNVDYNSKYSLHFSRESETSFKIKIIDVISKEIKYDNTITAQIKNTFNVNKLNIGYPSSAPLIAIDLKSLSITVDGKEVFSGSKIVQADGFKKSTDSDITDYDWVINTEEQTFRLPIKNGQEGVFASGVKGNGISLGLTDGTNNYGMSPSSNTENTWIFHQADYNKSLPNSRTTGVSAGIPANNTILGITSDSSKSGIVVDLTVPSGYNLYYYIGDTLQNADLINIARMGEGLVDIKSQPHIEEVYVNGTSGYRIWSKDSTGYRYCEQWGMTNLNVNNADFTFGIPMKDTNYIVTTALYRNSDGDTGGFANVNIENVYKKTTGIHISQTAGGLATMWKASGYAAD